MRLQDLLNEGRTGPPVRVVNWSYGPNRVPEAVVLLARAQELRPHVMLAVFHPGWFQQADYDWAGKPTPLSMFPGDVVDTAWLYRDRLPAAFRSHYLRPVTAVSALFASAWPNYRFRDLPVSWLQVTLREGQNRQVRRMTAAAGHPALRLVRVAVGPVTLGDLQPGQWRELKGAEVAGLRKL